MSTYATIAIEKDDGTLKSIYLNHDGYPAYCGVLLTRHYSDRAKLEKLIGLGELSVLKQKVDPVGDHSYDKPEPQVCIAYRRDRGQKDHGINQWKSRLDLILENPTRHLYLYSKEGSWLYAKSGSYPVWQELDQVLTGVEPKISAW